MRHLLCLLFLLLLCVPALAAPAPLETVSLSGVSGPNDTPTQAFSHARYNLLAAAQYARAVRQLAFCTARDPQNRTFHLALGCAKADRAASLGYALVWTTMLSDEQGSYPQTLKDWQAAQQDPKSDDYNSPRPTPPPDKSFPAKDDGKIVPPALAAVQIHALSLSAQSEWKQAIALSQTPAERADAEWVQGCGLRLLRLATSNLDEFSNLQSPPQADAPTQKDVAAALAAATRDAPSNPVYWQSLGDALRETDKDNAPAAYQKSLALQPKNAALWFRLYQSQVKWTRDPQPEAEATLHHAVDSDPGNAYPHFLLAGLLFHRTRFSDINEYGPESVAPALAAVYSDAQYQDADAALSEIEEGNDAPRYVVPEYVSPAPELLTAFAIWRPVTSAADVGFGEMAHLRELARAASGCGRICAAHGDRAGLERGTRAAVGMGLKMAGDWPMRDTPGGNKVMITLVGFAITGIGYSSLVKGYAALSDDGASAAAQAEWDAFKARQAQWHKTYDADTHTDSVYDDY